MLYVLLAILILICFLSYFCVFLIRIMSFFTNRIVVRRIVGILSGVGITFGGTAIFGFVVPIALFYIIVIGAACQLVFSIFKNWLPMGADKIYRSGIVPVALTVVILVLGMFNARDIQRTEYKIISDKVSHPVRIVFLSDVHLGTAVDADDFVKLSRRIENEKPDAVIVGGDWFDSSTTVADMKKAAESLGRIKTRYGVFYVYGNHDLYSGMYVPFEDYGITVLADKFADIGEITVLGRTDVFISYTGDSRASVESLLKDADTGDFIINVDHQPKELEKSEKCGIDLQLSGHTHSGQIFPFGYLSDIFGINEMNYGIRKSGDFTAITSSGAGVWGVPVRTQGICEYVCVDIVD